MRLETVDDYLAGIERTAAGFGLAIRRVRIGTSSQGREIVAYAIDGLPRKLLILGFPHPNEPLSQVVILHLLERAALMTGTGGDTWWLVPVWDVDGAHMNELWWSQPNGLTLTGMVEGWFRAATKYQVEWDFPLSYNDYEHETMLPETAAVARLIDHVHPDGLISLHNGTVGAAYAYAGGPDPSLALAIAGVLADSGLEVLRHTPVPYCNRLAKGVFTLPLAEHEIDFLKSVGDFGSDYTNGSASFEYVDKSCQSLVIELPLFSLDATLVPGMPDEFAARLKVLWSHFEDDLCTVFPRKNAGTTTDLLLSSPREFWERRTSDSAYVHSVCNQMQEWPRDEAVDRYFGLVFSIATQYAQMARALGREIGGSAQCFAELAHLAPAASTVSISDVERIADGIIRAFVGERI